MESSGKVWNFCGSSKLYDEIVDAKEMNKLQFLEGSINTRERQDPAKSGMP
jgi:hypothetical protein